MTRSRTTESADIAHDLREIERMPVRDYAPDVHDEAFSLTVSKGAAFAKAHLDRRYAPTRAERLERGEGLTKAKPKAKERERESEPER